MTLVSSDSAQDSSNTTAFDSSSKGNYSTYEFSGNTTDSLDVLESPNTTAFDSSPNGNDSTDEVIGNTTDSLDVQGSSNTSTFGSDVNGYDEAEVEPTADSSENTTDSQPLVEPSAAVNATVNESIHNPELRNLTTSDSAASPDQTIPDGNQQTSIATEGSGLSNVTNARSKGDLTPSTLNVPTASIFPMKEVFETEAQWSPKTSKLI